MAHIKGGLAGRGGVGGGVGWADGSGLKLWLRHRQQCCVFSKWHKQSQSTG